MAYVPPHKRHSKDAERPAPFPASLGPRFNKTMNLGGDRRDSSQHQGSGKIVYAADSISRWWPVGAPPGADPIPSSFKLEQFPCEPIERKAGAKPLVLASTGDDGDLGPGDERPWEGIAERVASDLAAVARSVRSAAVESEGEEVKMSFVARVGKVFFHGSSVSLDSIRKAAAAETHSRNQVHKSFYTNIPSDYMEDIEHSVIPTIGFDFESQREDFHVKVYDKSRPDSTLSCKCTVAINGGVLKIYKIELNQVRHLVVDISCLYKDLDLRLMLVTKKILKVLSDEEKDGISKLIESAVIDPDVKGGLRWPLGKESAAERFSVVGVWHTKYKAFKNAAMKLKLRHADRYDYRTSTGEVSTEVTLKLTAVSKNIRDGDGETGPLVEMVRDGVKLFWDHFLSYK